MTSPQTDSVAELRDRVAGLEQQLRQAQKLTALGELASTITHEFNNVLMTVINYAKLGLRQRDAQSRDRAFERILAAGNRAARITNGILALARNRTGALEPTALAPVIDDVLLLLERELSKYRIKVEKQIAAVPPAMANGNQLQQVLINLLINARQAMPQGGHVTVRLAYDEPSRMVELTVRDTGCGIPSDKLPRIFDRFFSTKDGPDASGKGGSGLGLAMCRDIIEAHKGKIRVESALGKGTAFMIRIPAAAQPASSLAVPVHAAMEPGALTNETASACAISSTPSALTPAS